MRVLRLLEDAGAAPVVFKGAALAQTHYAASWHRPRYDADLLIAPEMRERVCAILQSREYRRHALVSGELVMYQAAFRRVDHLGVEHALDVHWRIANPQMVSQALTHEELVDRSVIVDVQGHPMRVPSPVDSLLLACIHRVAHHPDFEAPCWIEDIHLLASRFEPSEWWSFVARASSREVRTVCLDGLTRARERFQTGVPTVVLQALAAGKGEASAILVDTWARPVDRLKADVRAIGARRGARLLREHLFPPAAYMQAKYGVSSRALLPAYYVVRAVNGLSKWLRPYVSATR